jgi:hypothetical protein
MTEDEIRTDHFWFGPGKGGACRLTHLPTGKSVQGNIYMSGDSSSVVVERLREELTDIVAPANIILAPAWITPTVIAMAGQIYNDRAFDRMPVLGDALEEAGCTVNEVLQHCRNGQEHARGCWVVDKVLGKG